MNRFVFVQGKDAYRSGADCRDNPYTAPGEHELWLAWRSGWMHMFNQE